MSTDTSNSGGLGVSADSCYIPAGWGSVLDNKTKHLVAMRCRNGSYGAAETIYGTNSHPCQVGGLTQSELTDLPLPRCLLRTQFAAATAGNCNIRNANH